MCNAVNRRGIEGRCVSIDKRVFRFWTVFCNNRDLFSHDACYTWPNTHNRSHRQSHSITIYSDGLGKFVVIAETLKAEVSLNRSRCVHDKVVEEAKRELRGC